MEITITRKGRTKRWDTSKWFAKNPVRKEALKKLLRKKNEIVVGLLKQVTARIEKKLGDTQ